MNTWGRVQWKTEGGVETGERESKEQRKGNYLKNIEKDLRNEVFINLFQSYLLICKWKQMEKFH